MPRPKISVDLRPYYQGEESGHSKKTLIVLHETVSRNYVGLWDIKNPAAYLDSKGYEIHGIVDMEGHSAWCYDPTAIYDHAASGNGKVNTRSIGFELVSEIPMLRTNAERKAMWEKDERLLQLDITAQWCAHLSKTLGIPLKWSNASEPGITSHWDVSRTYLGGDGHWDCHPIHKGGHFPGLYVVQKARNYLRDWSDA